MVTKPVRRPFMMWRGVLWLELNPPCTITDPPSKRSCFLIVASSYRSQGCHHMRMRPSFKQSVNQDLSENSTFAHWFRVHRL